MFNLNRLLVAQANKEFNRSQTAADAQELGKTFDTTVDILSTSNLYGLEAASYIKRIVYLYLNAANANISSGTVTEDWTRIKKRAARQLEAIVDKVLKQKQNFGEVFKAELILDIDAYKKEFLPNERNDYFDKTKWRPSENGNLEKTYIPMLETCIDSIYRIYCLYQLENATKADFYNRAVDVETVKLMIGAHEFAQDRVRMLLEPLETKNLNDAVTILDNIEKQHEQILLMSSAAEGKSSHSQESQTKINKTRLLAVQRAFAVELNKKEVHSEEVALRNIGTYAKRAAAVTLGGVGNAASLVGQGAGYLAEGAMNAITGPLEGKNAKAQREREERIASGDYSDDEDEEFIHDNAPKQMPPSPIMHQGALDCIWEYEGEENVNNNNNNSSATGRVYSPSTSTAKAPPREEVKSETDNAKTFELT